MPRREGHGAGPRRRVQPDAALGGGEEVVDDDADDREGVGTEGGEPEPARERDADDEARDGAARSHLRETAGRRVAGARGGGAFFEQNQNARRECCKSFFGRNSNSKLGIGKYYELTEQYVLLERNRQFIGCIYSSIQQQYGTIEKKY